MSFGIFPFCRKITANVNGPSIPYFPEKYLAQWLEQEGQQTPIYAFEPTGVRNLKNAYSYLIKEHSIDTVILVDGGTDSLMRGDEEDLGTPVEDSTSLAAVAEQDIPKKYLYCIGFGIDGISHYRFLENACVLASNGAYCGSFPLLAKQPESDKFIDAVDYSNSKMSGEESIICNSIASALEGNFGYHHRIQRTKGSKLWINPLMAWYWCFALDKVAKQMLYYEKIKETETHDDVSKAINDFTKTITKKRGFERLPL